MQIVSLILFESTPLNDVYRRSYKTHIDNHSLNALMDITEGGKRLSQQGVSQVAASIVRPSAETEGVANIVNGWGTARYRFILETIETTMTGNEVSGYYIGHTNYADGAVIRKGGGHILVDGQLQFFVNSVHKFKSKIVRTNGAQGRFITAEEGNQILYGGATIANVVNGAPNEWKIRPSEVYRARENVNQLMNSVYDGHIQHDFTGSLRLGAEASSRRNNAPGTYLFDTLNAFKQASDNIKTYGGDENSMISEAITFCRDGSTYNDPFFSVMRDFTNSLQSRGQFSYDQLCKAAPYANDILKLVSNRDRSLQLQNNGNLSNQQGGLFTNTWHAGNTAYWNSADNETVAAQLLVNAVPTILLESLGSNIRFTITNMTSSGLVETQPISCDTIAPQYVDRITVSERVMARVKNELWNTITMNGEMAAVVTVDADIFGDTMVTISLNGQPQRTYIMPTFADNAATPILTNSKQHFDTITHDMYRLGDALFGTNFGDGVIRHPQIIAQPQSGLYGVVQQQSTQQIQQLNPGFNPMLNPGINSLY